MGFWIFMLVMDLLIPITMIGFGRYFIKSAPKTINYVFGYRTTMSMKNEDTWKFAHEYCGKLWYRCGLLLLPTAIIPMMFVIGGSEDLIGSVGGIVCAVQMFPLIGSIIPVERALRANFDRDGNRRDPV